MKLTQYSFFLPSIRSYELIQSVASKDLNIYHFTKLQHIYLGDNYTGHLLKMSLIVQLVQTSTDDFKTAFVLRQVSFYTAYLDSLSTPSLSGSNSPSSV